MPFKKWLFQYCVALPVLIFVLGAVQYVKGRGLDYAIEFGLLWGIMSLTVFACVRAYNFRKNKDCALCNDLPAPKSETDR